MVSSGWASLYVRYIRHPHLTKYTHRRYIEYVVRVTPGVGAERGLVGKIDTVDPC